MRAAFKKAASLVAIMPHAQRCGKLSARGFSVERNGSACRLAVTWIAI
jgi:hypothetical protein